MRTQAKDSWNRVGFFAWLDQRIVEVDPPIPDMQSLAELAEVSHSALSNWRSGKYKPSLDRLRKLAPPLKVTPEFLAAKAGLIGEAGQQQLLTAEEQAGIDVIEASNLSRDDKDKLKVIHLANVARDRHERLRQLREQIDLLDRD